MIKKTLLAIGLYEMFYHIFKKNNQIFNSICKQKNLAVIFSRREQSQ
jgi:hypothetical protein